MLHYCSTARQLVQFVRCCNWCLQFPIPRAKYGFQTPPNHLSRRLHLIFYIALLVDAPWPPSQGFNCAACATGAKLICCCRPFLGRRGAVVLVAKATLVNLLPLAFVPVAHTLSMACRHWGWLLPHPGGQGLTRPSALRCCSCPWRPSRRAALLFLHAGMRAHRVAGRDRSKSYIRRHCTRGARVELGLTAVFAGNSISSHSS